MSLADKTPAVYRITNLQDGRVYIGSTKNLTQRFKQYMFEVDKCLRDPSYGSKRNKLISDIATLGWDNFKFEVVDASPFMQDDDLRAVREVELIMKYRSIFPEYGYNSTMGGESGPSKHRKRYDRKPKALFLYDTKHDTIDLYLKGTKTVHEVIGCKKDNVPDSVQRGKLVKNRYFIFYANSERRALFAEKIDLTRGVRKINGSNDAVAQQQYTMYKKALKAVDEYAKELEL